MIENLQARLGASDLCGGDAALVLIELRYEFGPITVVVEGVPAFRCPGFDEELVPGPIGVAISEMANRMALDARAFLDQLEPGSTEPVETIVRFPQHFRDLLTA